MLDLYHNWGAPYPAPANQIYIEDQVAKWDIRSQFYNSIEDKYLNVCAVILWQVAHTWRDYMRMVSKDYNAYFKIYTRYNPIISPNVRVNIGVNPRALRAYVEVSPNYVIKRDLKAKLEDMYRYMFKRVDLFFADIKKDLPWEVIFVEPAQKKDNCVARNNFVLGRYTIGYWASVNSAWNRKQNQYVYDYRFLDDYYTTGEDLSNYQIQRQKAGKDPYDPKVLYDQIHELNLKYPSDINDHTNIPTLYNKYKTLYKNELGITLTPIQQVQAWIGFDYIMQTEDYSIPIEEDPFAEIEDNETVIEDDDGGSYIIEDGADDEGGDNGNDDIIIEPNPGEDEEVITDE